MKNTHISLQVLTTFTRPFCHTTAENLLKGPDKTHLAKNTFIFSRMLTESYTIILIES